MKVVLVLAGVVVGWLGLAALFGLLLGYSLRRLGEVDLVERRDEP